MCQRTAESCCGNKATTARRRTRLRQFEIVENRLRATGQKLTSAHARNGRGDGNLSENDEHAGPTFESLCGELGLEVVDECTPSEIGHRAMLRVSECLCLIHTLPIPAVNELATL